MRARKTSRDAEWLECALSDLPTLLADHAHCEKKAAAAAIALIARYPEAPSLVTAMGHLAQEEMAHFSEVHQHLVARGWPLGPDLGDPYAQALVKQVRGSTKPERMVDRLLVGALIEARSFERLRLLGDHHPDPELRELYDRFARSEARHGHLFQSLARELAPGGREVADARMEVLATFEAAWVEGAPIRCAIH